MALICAIGFTHAQQQRTKTTSILEIYDVEKGTRTVVKEFADMHIEAPNWTMDGKWLIFNSRGRLYKISPDNPTEPILINTEFAGACNNDHVLSFDGKSIAISHGTKEDRRSRIYTLPIEGGTPRLITPLAPSYLHGWSPDGKWLAYCAFRDNSKIQDIYVIPAEGGEEIRLTTAEGLDDGPEYSPDGKYIWFNSVRTGLMQVWRMKTNGRQQTKMTFDKDMNSWFPHISPDGEKVVYIAYHDYEIDPGSHIADLNVQLRMIPAQGGDPEVLVEFFGGQGSLNVNS